MGRKNRISPEVAEDRKARHLLENRIKELETESKRLIESYDVFDQRALAPWDRFMDGDRLLYPAGFPSDRKAGQEWPILKTEEDLRIMRSFSRLLREVNPYAIGFGDHVANYVVGHGYSWEVVLANTQAAEVVDRDGDHKPDVDPAVVKSQQVLDEFRRLNNWGDAGEARVNQSLTQSVSVIHNRERETYDRAMDDGCALLRLFHGDSNSSGIPYCRPIESECITTPPGESMNGPWSWGIKTFQDEAGRTDVERIEEYHVADPYRPGALGEIVPAAHIVHLKLNTKSTVKRGIPDFFPIGDELRGASTLVRNMIKVSGILSAIAYIREHAPTTTAEQVRTFIGNSATGVNPVPANFKTPYGGAGPDATRYLTAHQAGMIIDVANQMAYQPGPINEGIPGFIQAGQATLRCVGLRWGCPEYFSGDASNANFASTLIAGGPFERATKSRQQLYKMFQQSLAVRVLLFAVASGRLTREDIAKVAVKVSCPPIAIANQLDDTGRRKILRDSAGLSQQTWLTEEGYDPAVELANNRKWSIMTGADNRTPPTNPVEK